MNQLELSLAIFCGSAAAGLLGSLSGLGGGVITVPLLVLFLGVDVHYAIGASLIAVIATSSVASTAYIGKGYVNTRIGLFLVTATSIGAIAGAFLGLMVPKWILFILFACMLVYSVVVFYLPKKHQKGNKPPNRFASWLRLHGSYPAHEGECSYQAEGVLGGYGLMFVAGAFSGLLGIGSGALKVLAMDRVMGLPFRVSTTTSNMMIGMTAAASAGVYLEMGYIEPSLAMPLVLGITCGSFLGARLFSRLHIWSIQLVFNGMTLLIAAEMFYDGIFMEV